MPNVNDLCEVMRLVANNKAPVEVFNALLKEFTGTELNDVNRQGWSPLFAAIFYRRVDFIEALLAKDGIDVNFLLKEKISIIFNEEHKKPESPDYKFYNTINWLNNSKHPKKGISVFYAAFMCDEHKIMEVLVAHKANVNHVCPGTKLLHPLVHLLGSPPEMYLDKEASVEIILKGNIDPELEFVKNVPILNYAAVNFSVYVVNKLLSTNKFDLNRKDFNHDTAIVAAAKHAVSKKFEIVFEFISHVDKSIEINTISEENKRHILFLAANGIKIETLAKLYKFLHDTKSEIFEPEIDLAIKMAVAKNNIELIIAFIHHSEPLSKGYPISDDNKKHLTFFASSNFNLHNLINIYLVLGCNDKNVVLNTYVLKDQFFYKTIFNEYKNQIAGSKQLETMSNHINFLRHWQEHYYDINLSVEKFIEKTRDITALTITTKNIPNKTRSGKVSKNTNKYTKNQMIAIEYLLNNIHKNLVEDFYTSFIVIGKDDSKFNFLKMPSNIKNSYLTGINNCIQLVEKTIPWFASDKLTLEQTQKAKQALQERKWKVENPQEDSLKANILDSSERQDAYAASSAAMPLNNNSSEPNIKLLFKAIKENSQADFSQHLALFNSENINQTDVVEEIVSFTALTMAVLLKRYQMVVALLQKGANSTLPLKGVNRNIPSVFIENSVPLIKFYIRNRKITPLYMALLHDDLELMSSLIKHGADVNDAYPDTTEECPLILSIQHPNEEMFKVVMTGNPNIGVVRKSDKKSALMIAQELGNKYIIDTLKKYQEQKDLPQSLLSQTSASSVAIPLESVNEPNIEQLVTAIIRNSLEEFNAQLALNINLDQTNIDGWTPLTVAIVLKRKEMVVALLKNSINVNLLIKPKSLSFLDSYSISGAIADENHNGFTPFYLAFLNSDIEMMQILVDQGADINCKNSKGNSLTEIAGKNKNLEMLVALICLAYKTKQKDMQPNESEHLLQLAAAGMSMETLHELYTITSTDAAPLADKISVDMASNLLNIKTNDFQALLSKYPAITVIAKKLKFYIDWKKLFKTKFVSFTSVDQFISIIKNISGLEKEELTHKECSELETKENITPLYNVLFNALEVLTRDFYDCFAGINSAVKNISLNERSVKEIEHYLKAIGDCQKFIDDVYEKHDFKNTFPLLQYLDQGFSSKAREALKKLNAETKRICKEKKSNELASLQKPSDAVNMKKDSEVKIALKAEYKKSNDSTILGSDRVNKPKYTKPEQIKTVQVMADVDYDLVKARTKEQKQHQQEALEAVRLLRAQLQKERMARAEERKKADDAEEKKRMDEAEKKRIAARVEKIRMEMAAEKKRIGEVTKKNQLAAESKPKAIVSKVDQQRVDQEIHEIQENDTSSVMLEPNPSLGISEKLKLPHIVQDIFINYFSDIPDCYLTGSAVKHIYRNEIQFTSDYDFIGTCNTPEILLEKGFIKSIHKINGCDLYRFHNIDFICVPEEKLDLVKDYKNRDFNLLYCDRNGNLFDPSGIGLYCIKSNILTLGENAEARLREDPRRILRALKAMAQGAEPDNHLHLALQQFHPSWIEDKKNAFYKKLEQYFHDEVIGEEFRIWLNVYNIVEKIQIGYKDEALQSTAGSNVSEFKDYMTLSRAYKSLSEDFMGLQHRWNQLNILHQNETVQFVEYASYSEYEKQIKGKQLEDCVKELDKVSQENEQLRKQLYNPEDQSQHRDHKKLNTPLAASSQMTVVRFFHQPESKTQSLNMLAKCSADLQLYVSQNNELCDLLIKLHEFKTLHEYAKDQSLYLPSPATNYHGFALDALKSENTENLQLSLINLRNLLSVDRISVDKAKIKTFFTLIDTQVKIHSLTNDDDSKNKYGVSILKDCFACISMLAEARQKCPHDELEYVDTKLEKLFHFMAKNVNLLKSMQCLLQQSKASSAATPN